MMVPVPAASAPYCSIRNDVPVTVDVGNDVKSAQDLAVVEAMKMENVLRAERDGTIGKIHAGVRASLAVDEVILEFE